MSDLQWLGLLVLGCTLVLAIMVYVVYRWLAQQVIALHKSLLANIRSETRGLRDEVVTECSSIDEHVALLFGEHLTTRNAVETQGKSTRVEVHNLHTDLDDHIENLTSKHELASLQLESTERKLLKGTRPAPPENADGARCTATAKSTGKRCKKSPMKGKTVCREHTHTPENQPAPAQESSDG